MRSNELLLIYSNTPIFQAQKYVRVEKNRGYEQWPRGDRLMSIEKRVTVLSTCLHYDL
jgi:hypothetical protein